MSDAAHRAPSDRHRVRRGSLTRSRSRLVVLAASALCFGAGAASAATLGGLGVIPMRAFDQAATSGAPTVYASDGFTAPDGTDLNGRTPLVGPAWVVDVPTLTMTGNRLGANGAALANAAIQTGQIDGRAEATITAAGARSSGILFNDSGARALYVLWSAQAGGRLRLIKYAGGATTLVTVSGVGTTSPSVMTVESQGNLIRVYLNGVLRIAHTLSAADLADFKAAANTRWGLIADGDANSRFDDFRVESL